MKQHYTYLIFGATALAAGLCERFDDVIVIEDGCVAAHEFAETHRPSVAVTPAENVPAQVKALYEECQSRGIIDTADNSIWSPAIAPVLSAHLLKASADCYFFSVLTDIQSVENGYLVSFNCYGVTYTVTAEYIIDTTADFITHTFFGEPAPKLTYQLHYLKIVNDKPEIFAIPCENGDIAAARIAAMEAESEPITVFAHEPDIVLADGETPHSVWNPSVGYSSFIDAFAAAFPLAVPDCIPTVTPEIAVDGNFDIILVGLGTAGANAAVTAKREGLSVLGIEGLYMMGGTATAGGVFGYYYGFHGGIYTEIDQEARSLRPYFASSGGNGFSAKIVCFDKNLMGDNRIDCRYHAKFASVLKNEIGKIIGVLYLYRGQLHKAYAKFVIDATAEASVCVSAGCAMQGGRTSDGTYQPFTNAHFHLGKADSVGMSYTDNGCVNPYDADSFGFRVLESGSSVSHLLDDYANRKFIGLAPLIGLREGRKLVGEENVSFDGIMAGNYSDKPVYYGFSNLDNHGKDSCLEEESYQDFITVCGLWGWGFSIPIPMGALIPKDTDGLLAAGRNVAVDHTLAMGLRMKDDCSKAGEAAVRLAALAIRDNIRAKDVSVDELREKLFVTGCLKPEDHMILERQKAEENNHYELPFWCDDDAAITAGMSSDQSGYSMWSAIMHRKTALLTSLLHSADRKLRWNAALALSIIADGIDSDTAALLRRELIACTQSCDGYVSDSSRRHLNLRSVCAINALRHVGTDTEIYTLMDMLERDDWSNVAYTASDLIMDDNDLAFQYRSHLVTTIAAIVKRTHNVNIASRLTAFADSHTFTTSIFGTNQIHTDVTETIRKIAHGGV